MTAKHPSIKHWGLDDLMYEEAYNTYAGRFFPFDGVPEPEWGGAWVAIAPGETSTRHSHQEKEMFFVVQGEGAFRLGDEEHRISYGDTVYVTPGTDHDIVNTGAERLVFLDVWWDTPESEKANASG
jgi:mannose-6-phosphate isomerase-like protein (cupin superfamily)